MQFASFPNPSEAAISVLLGQLDFNREQLVQLAYNVMLFWSACSRVYCIGTAIVLFKQMVLEMEARQMHS